MDTESYFSSLNAFGDFISQSYGTGNTLGDFLFCLVIVFGAAAVVGIMEVIGLSRRPDKKQLRKLEEILGALNHLHIEVSEIHSLTMAEFEKTRGELQRFEHEIQRMKHGLLIGQDESEDISINRRATRKITLDARTQRSLI